MQAGRQKAAIPLIRRFNEHSERLLKSALLVEFYQSLESVSLKKCLTVGMARLQSAGG